MRCVIDLRGTPREDLNRDWDAEEVEVRSHVVLDMGGHVCETKELVDEARSNDVGIRNDAALRCGVPAEVWDVDFAISDWVESISIGSANLPPKTHLSLQRFYQNIASR